MINHRENQQLYFLYQIHFCSGFIALVQRYGKGSFVVPNTMSWANYAAVPSRSTKQVLQFVSLKVSKS